MACSYAEDLAFLREYTEVHEIVDPATGSRVVVAPAWQGRILTSSLGDTASPGFGWIHREFIAAGQPHEKIHAYGGEDRFWLGPEGGQFSIFNPPGSAFDLESWRAPAGIDSEAYQVASVGDAHVQCTHQASFVNWSAARFDVGIDRELRLLPESGWRACLGVECAPAVRAVAFESNNTITNLGAEVWSHETGLIGIWTIGMFRHSPSMTVVVPYVAGDEDELGPIVNDAYFGKVPEDRLVVSEAAMFFKGDGQYRSKIGISPRRARNIFGSFDPSVGVLTLVQFDLPSGASEYVNSMWEHQDQPFGGDAINSYNDGAWGEGGEPLGPFYELETSSPAAALAPQESLSHTHRTMHLHGPRQELDALSCAVLGVGLDQIESVLR
jgi:hypothetical protein